MWSDHVFVVTAINTRQPHQPLNPVGTDLARSLGGPMSGAMISESTDERRWVLYDIEPLHRLVEPHARTRVSVANRPRRSVLGESR